MLNATLPSSRISFARISHLHINYISLEDATFFSPRHYVSWCKRGFLNGMVEIVRFKAAGKPISKEGGRAMPFINYAAREINCKIVYYGTGLGGKTTNLHHIYATSAPEVKGKMISLATETERTLFFDFLPLNLGQVRGFKTRLHLYTVPGQIFYDAARKLIIRGVDGVVFVADSQIERMDANIEAVWNLEKNLSAQGYDLNKLPYVLQLNKRDMQKIVSVAEMKRELVRKNEPVIEAVASEGIGVYDTLKEVSRQILMDLKKGSEHSSPMRQIG
jgi:mutual gliding-motility protein MglA